ncbi:MAG: hypothetical protein M1835_002954 [Candelina submexicana]|nr:MAG: hypothetical protein M1835_002954 [Candelina submexicana]
MKLMNTLIASALSIATLLCISVQAVPAPFPRDCCNETTVFTFDNPVWPEFSLEFLGYTIVSPNPFEHRNDWNDVRPSSPPRFALANPSNTSEPLIQVPDNSTDTFTLKSFRIASEGERGLEAIVQGFVPALEEPPVEQNFSLGGSGLGTQFLDFSPLSGWSNLNHVLIQVQYEGVDQPFVIDDFTVQKDCKRPSRRY